jgi:hypothetical protein
VSLSELSQVRELADRMASSYEEHFPQHDFSYRILLPRGERVGSKAKRLGLTLQGEFVLALRKKHIIPNIRDVRYVHDESHYGWILSSPEVLAQVG